MAAEKLLAAVLGVVSFLGLYFAALSLRWRMSVDSPLLLYLAF